MKYIKIDVNISILYNFVWDIRFGNFIKNGIINGFISTSSRNISEVE